MPYRKGPARCVRKWIALINGPILAGLLASLLVGIPVVAQEAFPWPKFVELTERKGDDVTQGGPCTHLGLNPDCRAYQAAHQDDEWTHAFNVVRLGNARTGHLILFKRSDTGGGVFYLTDLNGKLLRAVSRTEGASRNRSSWSKLGASSSQVRRGFAEELTYWRAHQAELESAPDRRK